MPTNYRSEDKIRLTEVERGILISLLKGKMLTYEIGRTMDADNNEDVPASSGTLYPALKRLCGMHMVEKMAPNGAKRSAGSIYKITSIGRAIIEHELDRLQDLIDTAKARSATYRHTKKPLE